MIEDDVIYNKKDIDDFESWVNLNKDALTWQGRFDKEFNHFWEMFFLEGLSFSQYMSRFDYAFIHIKTGPLSSWFSWLRDSFVCYSFIFKGLSIRTMGELSSLEHDNISIVIRNFYISLYPEMDDDISEYLQVTNILSPNLDLNLKILNEKIELDGRERLINSESLLQSMEVTLYEEWNILSKKIEKDFKAKNLNFEKIKTKVSFKQYFRATRDTIITIAVLCVVIIGTKQLNISWENSLLEKISIYEPQFKWLDRSLSFQDKDDKGASDFKLDKAEIDNVESSEGKFDEIDFSNQERYETESEVMLTSWGSLPKDFDAASLEQSGYEELKKRGYRDSRYGNTKVYRVMMKSVDTETAKEKLTKLLDKYEVTRVDNVEPGKGVPGGVYYNIYVPRKYLKEFMAQVMEVDDAILYESRTRTKRNPPGMNKVFIWIKNI